MLMPSDVTSTCNLHLKEKRYHGALTEYLDKLIIVGIKKNIFKFHTICICELFFYILRKSDAAEEWNKNKKIEMILLKSLQFEKQCGIMSIGHNSVMTVNCPSQL